MPLLKKCTWWRLLRILCKHKKNYKQTCLHAGDWLFEEGHPSGDVVGQKHQRQCAPVIKSCHDEHHKTRTALNSFFPRFSYYKWKITFVTSCKSSYENSYQQKSERKDEDYNIYNSVLQFLASKVGWFLQQFHKKQSRILTLLHINQI
jgi:hypothetical protein